MLTLGPEQKLLGICYVLISFSRCWLRTVVFQNVKLKIRSNSFKTGMGLEKPVLRLNGRNISPKIINIRGWKLCQKMNMRDNTKKA